MQTVRWRVTRVVVTLFGSPPAYTRGYPSTFLPRPIMSPSWIQGRLIPRFGTVCFCLGARRRCNPRSSCTSYQLDNDLHGPLANSRAAYRHKGAARPMKATLMSMMEGHAGSLAAEFICWKVPLFSVSHLSTMGALAPNTCAHMRMGLLGGSIALPLLVTRSNKAEANRARSLALVGPLAGRCGRVAAHDGRGRYQVLLHDASESSFLSGLDQGPRLCCKV